MNRRQFLASGFAVGLASATAGAASLQGAAIDQKYFELRKYRLHIGEKKDAFHQFLEEAAVPAWNQIGIEPVGVFSPRYGPNDPTLYLLLSYKSLTDLATATDRLLADKRFLRAGSGVLNAPLSNSAYVRMESWLLRAFEGMPTIELPPPAGTGSNRIFELRTYESHSIKAAKKKIEMFNEGGEIQIFRDTGLNPIFFGETLFGQRMPNLTYMLGFENMDARYEAWDNFRTSPAWKELSGKEEYKDTVSNISDIILRPMSYSQI